MHASSQVSLLFAVCIFILNPSHAFEGLLQAAGEVRKDRPARPLHFSAPDWQIYHRTDHLRSRIRQLVDQCAFAKLSSVTPLGLTSDIQDSFDYITITDRPGSVREITSHLLRSRTRHMFVFGEHGRDLVSSEIALRIVEAVCSPNVTRLEELGDLVPLARSLLPTAEIVLVPLVNPNGRKISEMGRRCERTNANDVDIDGNWPQFWNQPSMVRTHRSVKLADRYAQEQTARALRNAVSRRLGVNNASAQKNSAPDTVVRQLKPDTVGPEPLSEAETRALKIIATRLKPNSYVSVRTGAMAITTPWDCKTEGLSESQQTRLLSVTEVFTASHCTKCKRGNSWSTLGRTRCGTGTDYMFGTLHVPFVYTWHVYYASQAARGDCFRRHNPVSLEGYERVTNNWAQAVFNFSAAVHNWLALERTAGLDTAKRNASLSAAEAAARREDALARGVPDPEQDEDTHDWHVHDGSAAASGNQLQRGKHHPTVFQWVFGVRNNMDKVSQGRAAIGPHVVKAQAFSEDGDLSLLTGWAGTAAAMMLLCTGMMVARKYVFMTRTRKSRFMRRASMKHA